MEVSMLTKEDTESIAVAIRGVETGYALMVIGATLFAISSISLALITEGN